MTAAGSGPDDGASDPGDQHWLDAMSDAAVLLSPVYGRTRQIVDFRVDRANAAASQPGDAGIEAHLGESLLRGRGAQRLTPESATALASMFRSVLKTGTPQALDGLVFENGAGGSASHRVRDVRIGRQGDRLLVTLRDVTDRDTEEVAARRRERSLQALVNGVSDEALMTVDPSGTIVGWNTGAQRMYGYPAEEIVGRHYSVLYPRDQSGHDHPDPAGVAVEHVRSEGWQVRHDGSRFWAGIFVAATFGENEAVRGFSAVVRDLTDQGEQRRRDMHLAVTRTLADQPDVATGAARVLELTTAGLEASFAEIVIGRPSEGGVEPHARYAYPRATLDTLDAVRDRDAGNGWESLIASVQAGGVAEVADLVDLGNPAQVAAAAALGMSTAIACPIPAGSIFAGVIVYFFESAPRVESLAIQAIGEIAAELGTFVMREQVEGDLRDEASRMAELASTDRLTGLKNRREFDRIMGAIPRQPFAILAIDVDHLKFVNDEYGHEAGDTVLRTVGTTLAVMLRGWDVIARVGGDEFAAILLNVDAAEASTAAQRLRAAMHLVPSPGDRSNISLGWASAPAGTDPMTVWKYADECLYEAKRKGRDRVVGRHIDDAEHPASSGTSTIELIAELVGGRPMHAVYQPILDLNDGHVIGYEALARPQGYGASDSVEGLFQVAHRSGQMRDLDWLCRRAALGQAAGLPDGVLLFMNVSLAALLDPLHDVDQLLLLLEWAGRSPKHLVLEIGEHEDVRDLHRFRQVLAAYRGEGVRFAIDDLGEGFATTELLASAEAEYVKLARSLTMSSVRRGSRAAIKAALAFAHANNSAVIAEGVENELVSDQIRSLEVPLGQGFGLGRPRLASDVADTAAAWNARATLRPLRPRNGRSAIKAAS